MDYAAELYPELLPQMPVRASDKPMLGTTGTVMFPTPYEPAGKKDSLPKTVSYEKQLKDGLVYLLRAGGIESVGKLNENPELAGKGYAAYRDGNRLLVSDKVYKGDNLTLENVAAAVAYGDPLNRYVLAHEAMEETVASHPKEDAKVHRQIHLSALTALYSLGDVFGVREGVRLGQNLDYGKGVSYEMVERLHNDVKRNLPYFDQTPKHMQADWYRRERRATGLELPTEHAALIAALGGRGIQYIVEFERAAGQEWLKPESIPRSHLFAKLTNALGVETSMLWTGLGHVPISMTAQPAGFSWVID